AGLDILEHHAFRVTRTRDLEVDEDVTEDLMQSLERELQKRRFEPAVRLEVEDTISSDVLEKLVTELGIDHRAVYHLPGPLDLSGLSVIADEDLPQLKYPPFVPSESALPQDTHIFPPLPPPTPLTPHRGARAGRLPPAALRPVHRNGGTADRGRRGRPRGAGDQADPLPDQRPLPDRGRADRRGRGRQAGGGGRGAQGKVRRARQHQLGAQAGGSGLPCGVRDRRPEDPLQDGPGRAGGTGRVPAPLLPYRDRQLPPDDRPAV